MITAVDLKSAGIVDTMIGFALEPDKLYGSLRKALRDESQSFAMPAQYMFHDVPNKALDADVDRINQTVEQMDRHGIAVGLISVSGDPELADQAMTRHPGRFVGSWTVDPGEGMVAIRKLVEAHQRCDIRAVSLFPHMSQPQVALDAPLSYVLYSKCVELGLPVLATVGLAGPRVPSNVQHVERIDQIMYDFPDLVFVMRHGAEPWVDLAVKLMLKWPNLHYSTTGFAPRYYPKAIVDYANTRGAGDVLYGGYFPMGLGLDRIMSEMAPSPLRCGRNSCAATPPASSSSTHDRAANGERRVSTELRRRLS
jgi:predicted TIM-barrel fold metal-dependent hydrolase